MPSFRTIACAWAVVLLGAGVASGAEPPTVDALREQFPPGSIESTVKADAALAAIAGAKTRVEKDFKTAGRECLAKVLVNDCLDRIRAVRRAHLADIETIELEANRQKRRDKADRLDADRTKREAERTAHAPTDAELRARNRKSYDDKQAEATRAAESAARRAGFASKPHKPAVKLAAPQGPDAAKREKNAVAYESHVKEADEHQEVIARRLVEKAADRKRRAEAKAVKEAKDAKVAQAAREAAGLPAPAPTPGSKP